MERRHYRFVDATFCDVVAHDGESTVTTARVWEDGAAGGFLFIDLTVIEPGHSIGRHTHGPHDEEAYVIVAGHGQMFLDGETVEVGPGDVIVNAPGGTHGLVNTGTEPLRMVVLDCAAPTHRGRNASA